MLGSGASAILIAAGVSPHWHLGVLALLVMAGAWWGIRPALAGVPEAEDSDPAAPNLYCPHGICC